MRRRLLLLALGTLAACGGGGGGGGGGGAVATPTFSPPGATYAAAQSVTITTTTAGAAIHYTTDGSAPTAGSPTYAAPIPVGVPGLTIKALATKAGLDDSAVASATYVISPAATPTATPVISPGSGSYAVAQTVTITCATAGASIYYTTDGGTPTAASTAYAGPIAVNAPGLTIKAVATAPGHTSSAVATAVLTVTPALADFAAFCAGASADVSGLLTSCLKANPLTDRSVGCASLSADVAAGRSSYDPTHAAACRAALVALGCAIVGAAGGPPTECRLALPGHQLAGEVCFDDTNCQLGQRCDLSFTCPGRCTANVAQGGACTDNAACASGLLCTGGGGTAGTCEAPQGAGATCGASLPCGFGLYCGAGGTCLTQQTSGACGQAFDQCAIGYTCRGSPSPTCQALVDGGGSCDSTQGAYGQCGFGWHCDGTNHCVSDPVVGQPCAGFLQCIDGTCDGVTCQPFGNLGDRVCASPPGVAGLTLFDAFKAAAPDGTRWQAGGMVRRVEGGALTLGVDVTNARRRSDRNDVYNSVATITPGGRVTTLTATITVPAASATVTGAGVARASVRTIYQPPARRLTFPGGLQDFMNAEVGLWVEGGAVHAFRQFSHCDDASCASLSTTGIAFADSTALAALGQNAQAAGAAAALDTTYTATIRLDEATGVFHWSITGGALGAGGLSGTADPAAYLAGSAGWSGVPLAGTGYSAGQLLVRGVDDGAGGATVRLRARFDDVQVGVNDAPAAAYDDFGGSGVNSGPGGLAPGRWGNPGAASVALEGGSLVYRPQAVAPGAGTSVVSQALPLGDPASVNALSFLATLEPPTTDGTSATAFLNLAARIYGDGSHTRANDATGDVQVIFQLSSGGGAFYFLNRCTNAQCGATTGVGSGSVPGAVAGPSHRVLLRWDPVGKLLTLGVDGSTKVVDPGAASAEITAPVAAAAAPNAPVRNLTGVVNLTATAARQVSSAVIRVNDVYTGP